MENILDQFHCIVADNPTDIMAGGGVDLWVTKEQFEELVKICSQSQKCVMIIYDFRPIENDK